MPRINTNTGLGAIINKHNLRRNQAACQLRNWKGMAYENTQITLVVEPGDIEAAIADSLSMPFSEFITEFVGDLLSGGEVVPGSSDLSNSYGMTETRSLSFKAVIAFRRDNLDHGCNKIRVVYLK